MKICPYCSEEIQDEATKCKHCKKILKPTITDNLSKDRKAVSNSWKASLLKLGILFLIIFIGTRLYLRYQRTQLKDLRIRVTREEISQNVSLPLRLYKLDNGEYPTTRQGLNALLKRSLNAEGSPYLTAYPHDSWGQKFKYKSPGVHNVESFDLYSVGEDGIDGTDDDITNW